MTYTTSLRERLRSEVMRAAMKDNFVLSRDDVIELLGGMSAILSARTEPQAGEWVLVPREPTPEMREAGKCAHNEAEARCHAEAGLGAKGMFLRANRAAHVYSAMLAAAPSPAPRARPEAQGEAYPTGSDREVLLYLMQQFDAESWECPRCGHSEDCATMDSADYLRRYLATPPADRAPGEATVLEVAFEYENGANVPTVLVGFAPEDWAARDRFAASLTHKEPAR